MNEGENNNGKIIGGCCAAAALAGVAIGMVFFVLSKKGVETIKQLNAENVVFDESLKTWMETATESEMSSVFPDQFAGFARVSVTEVSKLPFVDSDHPATEAVYENGSLKFKVTAANIDGLNHNETVEAALESAKSQGVSSHMKGSLPSYSRLSFSHGGKSYYIRGHSNGWLFVVEYDRSGGDAKDLLRQLFDASNRGG